jgi:hypothetical protein
MGAVLAALALAACGSSSSGSGNANTVLSQTFSGSHKVTSGKLSLSLTVDPSGSSTLSGPISVSFGGPFQTRGSGKLPASNFTVSVSALGRNGSLGILSTGTTGYVTLQGVSYQMPQATFQKLESSFAQLTSSQGSSSGSGALGKLGIDPLHWLTNPTIVGTENVGGAQTTHIHAGVNVNALLGDLNTLVEKASSLGVSGASSLKSGIPSKARSEIAAEIRNPSVDIWTGTSDKTIRKLTISLALPVTGKVSNELGGMTSADLALTMQYSNLNQPQPITAPTSVKPFSQFETKLQSFLQAVQGAAQGAIGSSGSTGTSGSSTSSSAGSTSASGGSTSASGGTTSSSGGTTSTAGSGTKVTRYSQCIAAANGDVTKMQKCASLLGAG